MRLYQKIALTGAAILATLGGLILSKADSLRDNPKGLERTVIQTTEANRQLRAFPDDFGEYGTVRKYEVPGARHCLAQIRQMHFAELGMPESVKNNPELIKKCRDIYAKSFSKTNKCQQDIFFILDKLSQKGYNELRLEGVNSALSKEDIDEEYSLVLRRAFYLSGEGIGSFQEHLFLPGAGLMIGKMGKMKILPAERLETHKAALEDINNKKSTHDVREDVLLGLIDESGEPFTIVVYGGNHNFMDNIDRWNKRYPTKTFSSVRVTPKNYKK